MTIAPGFRLRVLFCFSSLTGLLAWSGRRVYEPLWVTDHWCRRCRRRHRRRSAASTRITGLGVACCAQHDLPLSARGVRDSINIYESTRYILVAAQIGNRKIRFTCLLTLNWKIQARQTAHNSHC